MGAMVPWPIEPASFWIYRTFPDQPPIFPRDLEAENRPRAIAA
jgi:hypothetical protein